MMDAFVTSDARWTRLFGVGMSFEDEIRQAQSVRSTTRVELDQVLVLIDDPLSGWEVPLWGSDDQFIYLRRPEGVWRTRLPAATLGQAVMLCVRDPNQPSEFMETHIGCDIGGRGGWLHRDGAPRSPDDVDVGNDASLLRPEIVADELGWMVIREHARQGDRFVFDAGPAFGSHPCALVGNGLWVIGTDSASSRAVAFKLGDSARIALEHQELWLRFSGDLLLPFEARVKRGF